MYPLFCCYEKEEYINDTSQNYKGTILQYMDTNEDPHYVYSPFLLSDINSDKYEKWVEKTHKELIYKNPNYEYIKTLYWKLVKISCVLVLRNKFWFNQILPDIKFFWDTLVEERETGKYKERISKKRKLQIEHDKSRSDFPNSGCLIDMKNI